MKAPIAVAVPVTSPSLSGASSAGWMLSSSRTIASSACAGSCIIARAVSRAVLRRQALRLVDDGELVLFQIRHQPHLVAFQIDLMRLDLGFTLRGQVAAGAHR